MAATAAPLNDMIRVSASPREATKLRSEPFDAVGTRCEKGEIWYVFCGAYSSDLLVLELDAMLLLLATCL